jgi:hypothetical protein
MQTKRSAFLEAFIKVSPDFNTVFLNHCGNPVKLLSDIQVIEILSTKKSFKLFREFALSHPLVSKLDVTSSFRKKEVWIELNDGTALHFMFYHELVYHSMSLISVKEFIKAATVNEFGMLSLPLPYQFDYLALRVQFTSESMADRFRNYFSALEQSSRAIVFSFMQPRYDLVMNVIEDLYEPAGHIKYKMMVGLRHSGRNSLLRLAVRVIQQGIFSILHVFTPRTNSLIPDPGQQQKGDATSPALKKAQNY